ncbi:hypothetical protein PR048_010472 [Dryococelus australis]|uniref:Uncharacterized protein n=1 Tax=Dryococelus australis TaxID=614101 RepID=A0ABQ9I4T7_9NEOP|nr:hypothetical protein PR048_010472 [Dryococelus australis]
MKFPDTYFVDKVLRRKKGKIPARWLGLPKSKESWMNMKYITIASNLTEVFGLTTYAQRPTHRRFAIMDTPTFKQWYCMQYVGITTSVITNKSCQVSVQPKNMLHKACDRIASYYDGLSSTELHGLQETLATLKTQNWHQRHTSSSISEGGTSRGVVPPSGTLSAQWCTASVVESVVDTRTLTEGRMSECPCCHGMTVDRELISGRSMTSFLMKKAPEAAIVTEHSQSGDPLATLTFILIAICNLSAVYYAACEAISIPMAREPEVSQIHSATARLHDPLCIRASVGSSLAVAPFNPRAVLLLETNLPNADQPVGDNLHPGTASQSQGYRFHSFDRTMSNGSQTSLTLVTSPAARHLSLRLQPLIHSTKTPGPEAHCTIYTLLALTWKVRHTPSHEDRILRKTHYNEGLQRAPQKVLSCLLAFCNIPTVLSPVIQNIPSAYRRRYHITAVLHFHSLARDARDEAVSTCPQKDAIRIRISIGGSRGPGYVPGEFLSARFVFESRKNQQWLLEVRDEQVTDQPYPRHVRWLTRQTNMQAKEAVVPVVH